MVSRWEGGEGKGKKCEGDYKIRTVSYKISHRYVKYRIGNIVNHIAITMYSSGWVLNLSRGDHFKVYKCLIMILYA